MDFRFNDDGLARLYGDAGYEGGRPQGVVKGFRKRMQQIGAATDERAFYTQRSLHFEELKGARAGEFSMRINDQWRLILRFEGKGPSKVVVVMSIEDYH